MSRKYEVNESDYIIILEDKIKQLEEVVKGKDAIISCYREALTKIGCKLEDGMTKVENPRIIRYSPTLDLIPENLEPIPLKTTRITFDRRFAYRTDMEEKLKHINLVLSWFENSKGE